MALFIRGCIVLADVGGVILGMGAATVLNAVYDLQTGKGNVTVTVIAGTAATAILIIVGSATGEWELSEAFAAAFFVGSLFLHGAKIAGIGTLLNAAPPATPASSTKP